MSCISSEFNSALDFDAVEVQVDTDGTVENSYRVTSNKGLHLLNKGIKAVPNCLLFNDLSKIELISEHKADNVTYNEDAVVLVFNENPNRDFDVPLRDYYAVKIFLDSGQILYKYYREYCFNTILGKIFNDFHFDYKIANEFGIGFYGEDMSVSPFLDFYIYTKHVSQVYDWFGFNQPDLSKKFLNVNTGLFGLTYDTDCKKVVKIKRYLYPNDLSLNRPELIYGD